METGRDPPEMDIRKMGVLKKMKTNKKKFFVLRVSSAHGPARLEYYDTEKKFRNNNKANRSIEMKACFNISKRQDTKHKHVIALYTKDDCFSLVMENSEEQEAWLQALNELQSEEYGKETGTRLVFDFVWQVTVKNAKLGLERGITGKYRLCLSDNFLSLMKICSEAPEYLFQLNVIRKCGHTDQYFVLEVGRSSPIGAGELLMQVEDNLIAQEMHEEILSAMKSAKASQEQITIRPRTRSSVDKSKTQHVRGGTSPHNANQEQMRGRTMSEGHKSANMSSPRARLNLSPKIGDGRSTRPASSYTRSGSIPGISPFSSTSSIHGEQLSHRYRSDSTGSRGTSASGASVDEMDSSPGDSLHGLSRSMTPDNPIREEGTDYLTMSYGQGQMGSNSSASTSCSSLDKRQVSEAYMDMTPVKTTPASEDASEYVDMSAGSISSSKSSVSSLSKSHHGRDQVETAAASNVSDDGGYLDMAPVSQSLPTVREKTAPEGYCEMSSGQGSYTSSGLSLGLRPDKVYSYLSEDPHEDFPKRAYSVGSKTELKLKPRPYLESIVLDKSDQKSSSAPHLNSEKVHGHHKNQSPVGSQSPASQKSLSRRSSREDSELFMEMTFDRPRTSSESHGSYYRVRTSSWGQNFRPRSSSHSQTQRVRRTPDSKHSSQELKKDSSCSSSQEIGSHDLHSKHQTSSESVKRSSQESLKKVSQERRGSLDKLKRGMKDSLEYDSAMAAPSSQKTSPVPPMITGVSNVSSGEDYLAMSPGTYSGGYNQRHSPTSLRRSPIMEGESVTFGADNKYGRGQTSRGYHSLTPGKSGSMKARKDTSTGGQKMRRGYSADSSENYMVLNFGDKSKSDADDSYVVSSPGKDVSSSPVVTAAMLDKVISPIAQSHIRNKSSVSLASHSSVDSSDDYCMMETDSSARLSDTGSTSSGCLDPFQLIRKSEQEKQPSQERESSVSRRLDYDQVKPTSDVHVTSSDVLMQSLDTKPLKSDDSAVKDEPGTESLRSESQNVEKTITKSPDTDSDQNGTLKKVDPFGLHKPVVIKPESELKSLDVSKYPFPSIPCPRSPIDLKPVLPADSRREKGPEPIEGATAAVKPAETSPGAFIPGQRRSVSDVGAVDISFSRSSSNQSTASEDQQLNYAALDLDISEDLRMTGMMGGAITKPDSDNKPLQYAQIDFIKSDELKTTSNVLSENPKPPLDFLQ